MKSLLLQLTGEMPLFKIIDFFVENKGMDFSKQEIIERSRVSRASLFQYWHILDLHGIVKVTRKFDKAKLYTLNADNEVTKRILDLEKALIFEALSKEQRLIKTPILT